MEETLIKSDTLIPVWQVAVVVGALVTAVIALWLWGRKKDSFYRADIKEFTKDFKEIIKSNTESNVALKSAVEANTKATERLPDTVHLAIHKALPK